jgi:hypothetical protein
VPIVLTRATKQAARYTPLGGSEHCSACRFYMPQGTCGRIIGPVSPEGWCKYYSREAVQRSNPGYAGFGGQPPGLTADLNFMLTPGTLPPGVVFTRASTATYFDVTGAIQTASTNTPRWTYDPVTHASRGLLMETSRTNLLLNSATLGTQSVAVTAQAYMLSFYGTGTITLTGTSTAGPLVGTGAFPQRVALTFTPTAGTLTCTVTGSVLNAQLEAGSFASSWISTTGAAATRAADVCSLTDAVLLGGTTDRTLAVNAYAANVTPAGVAAYWACVDDASNNNVHNLISPGNSTNLHAQITVGAVSKVNGGDTTGGTRPGLFKAALANGAIWNGAVNGVLMAGAGGASQQHGPLTTLHCGCNQLNAGQCDGAIQRVRYWPRGLSQAELLQVTT